MLWRIGLAVAALTVALALAVMYGMVKLGAS